MGYHIDALSYTSIDVLAIISLLIVCYKFIFTNDPSREIRAYRDYLIAAIITFVSDAGHGYLEAWGNVTIQFYNTILYYLAMTLTVALFCRYVLIFLDKDNALRKHINTVIACTCIIGVVVLIYNSYEPVIFWYDDNGHFHFGEFRLVVLTILVFLMLALNSLYSMAKHTGERRMRSLAIATFASIMTVAAIGQYFYPTQPMNSVGLFIGTLVVHIFIHQEQIKTRERKQRAELTRLKDMLESNDIGTWQLTSMPGQPQEMGTDAKMKELMGLPADTDMSDAEACAYLIERINPDDIEPFMEYDKLLKAGNRGEITYRWQHPTKGERYVRCGGIAQKSDVGYKSIGYHYDVTDQVKNEVELKNSIEANKIKTRFLQNMSHEIRTPLNAMFGFSQLLGLPDGSWTEEEKDKYNMYIYTSYNMLDMLINDILDLADSEHGNYRIELSDVNINDVCRSAIMSVEFRRPETVSLKFTSDFDDDYTVTSDSRRIQQVLINYLTNACKNTEKGEVHLHCSKTEKPGKVTFSVTDTGKGVPPEKAEEIFGRFTKLDHFVQGSGLGLNICHTIATKLGGEVYLDTTYKEGGARFVFVIDCV